MSRTYEIECTQCKEYVWVGQSSNSSPDGLRLYGDDNTRLKTQRFLVKHEGHPLRFVELEALDWDSTEFEPESDE